MLIGEWFYIYKINDIMNYNKDIKEQPDEVHKRGLVKEDIKNFARVLPARYLK